MMNLEEIKAAIAALTPEEQRQLTRYLDQRTRERGAKLSEPQKNPAAEMDAWADSEAGGVRFKDGR